MRHFYKIAYNSSHDEAERVYQQRFQADSATRLPFSIQPINQTETFPLYYVPTDDMIRICCAIHVHSRELQSLIEALPEVARRQFVFETIIAEMQNTNEIEGVASTRAELVDSAREDGRINGHQRRFSGLVRTYFTLIRGEVPLIRTPGDIRSLYDSLVLAEIKPEERPDGAIFRKDIAHVTRRSGSGKVIHQGLHPEGEIIAALERLLLLAGDNSIPNLLKIAIFHYLFGYIHPFYDGNGRTARFISSCQIRQELGAYSAITLSRACNRHAGRYADLFEITNNARNRGELNAFIEGFLDLINEGHRTVILELREKQTALDTIEGRIGQLPMLQGKGREPECDVLFALAQHELFTDDVWISLNDLYAQIAAHQIGSAQRVRQALHRLEAAGLVRTAGLRPKKYAIRLEALLQS